MKHTPAFVRCSRQLLLAGLLGMTGFSPPLQAQSAGPWPASGSAALPAELRLLYSWEGEGPELSESYCLSRQAQQRRFQAEGSYILLPLPGQQRSRRSLRASLPETAVAELLKVLQQARWQPVRQPVSVDRVDDDEPRFEIGFSLDGTGPVSLFSASDAEQHLPWNLSLGGKTYISADAAITRSVLALFNRLRPDDGR